MPVTRHVVWDWNGTLLDDLPVVVDAVNHALDTVGAPHIDADGYRDHYTRPVVGFYEAVLGRVVADAEWRRLDDAFHEYYRDALHDAPLTADAREAFEIVARSGATQSILSMWWHSELVPAARRLGLHNVMVSINGTTGADPGAEKAAHLAAHLRALAATNGGFDHGEVVVVGDVPDDGAAARAVGARCVLYDGGSHHVDHLRSAGWPVAHTLLEAVALAGLGDGP